MAKKAKSRTRRQTRGHQTESDTIVFHGVQSSQLESTNLITTLRTVKDGQTAREWLGLTLKDLGESLAQTTEARRAEPYSKQYISQLEHGHRPWLPDLRAGVARLMTDRLHRLTGETIGVSIRINSPWHVRLWRVCGEHGRYEIDGRRKHCPLCGKG